MDLRPNLSLKDDCTFAATRSALVASLSDVYATPEEGCLSSAGFAAVCQAVILSERGLFLDGLREMLGKSRISVIGEAQDIPKLLITMQTQPVPDIVICHIPFDRKPEAALDLIIGLRQHFARAKLVGPRGCMHNVAPVEYRRGGRKRHCSHHISSDMLLQSLKLVLFDHRLFPSEIMPLITGSAEAAPRFGPATVECLTRFAGPPLGTALPGTRGAAECPCTRSTVDGSTFQTREDVMNCLVGGGRTR